MVVPRLLLGCVVLATAICSTLASTEDPVLRDLLATYAAQRDGGDYATALKTILQAREHSPWDPALLALLGEAYGNVRDWGRAIWVLRDAIAFGDQRQSTRRNLALALARSGWELWEAEDSAGASIRFRESLGVFPNTAPAQGGMGRLLLDERRLQEALPYLRAAVELEPNDPNYRGDLALCLELLGQMDEALAHLQAAVEAVPANSTNQNDLAWMLFGLGRSQEGLRHAQTAVELEPTDPTLLHTLAAIQLDMGEIEEALLTIQDAVRQKPAGPLVRATLGACLARVGRAEEARAELLRAEGLYASLNSEHLDYPWVAYYLGIGYEALGENDTAAAWRQRLLSETANFPRQAEVRQSLGQEGASGATEVQALPEPAPTLPSEMVARAEAEAGEPRGEPAAGEVWPTQPEGAGLEAEEARAPLSVGPESAAPPVGEPAAQGEVPQVQPLREGTETQEGAREAQNQPGEGEPLPSPELLNSRAWELYGAGKLQEALPLAQEAVRLSQGDPALLHTLGAIQLELGQPQEAFVSLQRAIESDPGCPIIRATLAACLVRLNRYQEALGELNKARKRIAAVGRAYPEYEWAAYYIGVTYEWLGARSQAIHWLEHLLQVAPEFPRARSVQLFIESHQ